MNLKRQLIRRGEWLIQSAVDHIFAQIPYPIPSTAQLQNIGIVAHRGSHRHEIENTLAAFDHAVLNDVDAIEFDVRWTSDEHAVISHDESFARVFSMPLKIAELTYEDLRQRVPLMPTLHEVIQRYTGSQRIQGLERPATHLMIELKGKAPSPGHGFSHARLLGMAEQLKSLRAGLDFHLMCLDPEGLAFIEESGIFPPHCLLSIALVNTQEISRRTLQTKWAGFTGHYVLITEQIRHRHKKNGQRVGVGFVQSKNVLKRECLRDVAWVFSNDAVQVARWRKELRLETTPHLAAKI